MSALILPFRGVLPTIAADAFIAPDATLIGKVEIGARSGIWFGCVLRGDVAHIRVGAMTNIQDGTVIHCSRVKGGDTIIGSGITIGHRAVIHACVLEDGSFIGMNACVMDGAVVESGAWIAAGALVTPGKRVPKGQLWAGTPARYLRDVNEKERAVITGTAEHYADLAQEYLVGG